MTVLRLAGPVLMRPHLWPTAVRAAIRYVPDRWWRYGPLPRREFLRFRIGGVYGVDSIRDLPGSAVVDYLEWCRRYPRERRRRLRAEAEA